LINHDQVFFSHFSMIGQFRLDPHADTGALTPSADWVKCCYSKNFLESF